jgi:hypothetical protein
VLGEMTKALSSTLSKHWGGGEAGDIAQALYALQDIQSLILAEEAEDEDEAVQLELLEGACELLGKFIEMEAAELAEDLGGEEAGKPPAAVGGERTAEAVHGKALGFGSRALLKAIKNELDSRPGAESMKAEDGVSMAEALAQGFGELLSPISKALGELKAGIGELKAVDGGEVGKRLTGIEEAVKKVSEQPAVAMPVRNREGIEQAALATKDTATASARAMLLRKYAYGQSADVAAYLERCAQIEERGN